MCSPADENRNSPAAVSTMAGYMTGFGPNLLTSRAVKPKDMAAMATAWGRKARPVSNGL